MTVGEPMIAVFQVLRSSACSRRMVATEASSEKPVEDSVNVIKGVVRWKVVERECSGGCWVGDIRPRVQADKPRLRLREFPEHRENL
jgi:hypothetical protein